MLIVFGIIIAGFITGLLIRQQQLKHMPQLITMVIWVLLFLLGLDVGSNPQVIDQIGTLGWSAFILFFFSVTGSIGAAYLLQHFIKMNNRKRQSR
ncbi:LysO family transporter [Mangrovibacterium marinum]|uniref:Lysine exporter LysO-like protein n=1 Tax=Mangrovibacterium marinum TaxID=1639118 RepID=A0A2T5BXW0_9BACT|nr:LysO family transporter [Mangrovibacterium marinum]PTN06282.1 lysine exporter LysO-like protein [Mangrovibacterium marinum]